MGETGERGREEAAGRDEWGGRGGREKGTGWWGPRKGVEEGVGGGKGAKVGRKGADGWGERRLGRGEGEGKGERGGALGRQSPWPPGTSTVAVAPGELTSRAVVEEPPPGKPRRSGPAEGRPGNAAAGAASARAPGPVGHHR